MRIATITTAVIEANYDWTIVRVESDDGVCGWGEAFCAPGLAQTIRELASLLEGEDARQVEPLVRKLYLATAHVSSGGTVYHAISGIEAALWDLAARSLDVPLWQLFGGRFRERVRIYADCHAGEALTSYGATLVSRQLPWMERPSADLQDALPEVHWAPAEAADVYTPDAYAARAREMANSGFTALKFDLDLPLLPHEDLYARTISASQLERQVALAEATVAAVAGRAEVAFDLHWRYAPADALRLARALEHLPLLWLEDPTPPQDLESIARISERTHDPDLHRREPLPPRRLRGTDLPRRRRHPRTRHPEGRRAQRHATDRCVRRRPLATARPAQHRRADRHARLGARLRVDPELPRARVACGVRAVLRRARDARPTGDRGRVRRCCPTARESAPSPTSTRADATPGRASRSSTSRSPPSLAGRGRDSGAPSTSPSTRMRSTAAGTAKAAPRRAGAPSILPSPSTTSMTAKLPLASSCRSAQKKDFASAGSPRTGSCRPRSSARHCGVPAEAQMAVLGPDREACPLAQEREVRRLLELGDEQPRPERMRHPGRHVDDVARAHGDPVQRTQEPVNVLLRNPLKVALGLDGLAEADPDLGLAVTCVQHDPRLRLAKGRVEGLTREGAVRVCMHREPLRSVEQLDEQARRRAEAGDVLVAEPPDRIGLHRVAEEATVGEAREALVRIVSTGISREGDGPDPVLRKDAVLLGLSAQPSDERSASIEAVDPGRQQALGAHTVSDRRVASLDATNRSSMSAPMSAPAAVGADRPTLRIRGTAYPVLLPTLRDPRLHLAAVIISLQVSGRSRSTSSSRSPRSSSRWSRPRCSRSAIAFRRQRVIMWPASALLTGNGVAFILRVPGTEHGDWWSMHGWWIFAGTSAIALLSKYLISSGAATSSTRRTSASSPASSCSAPSGPIRSRSGGARCRPRSCSRSRSSSRAASRSSDGCT